MQSVQKIIIPATTAEVIIPSGNNSIKVKSNANTDETSPSYMKFMAHGLQGDEYITLLTFDPTTQTWKEDSNMPRINVDATQLTVENVELYFKIKKTATVNQVTLTLTQDSDNGQI